MATTKYALNTTPSNQKRHTNVATVRALKGGIHFEIACYRNKVLSWRSKIETDIGEVLQIEQIFTNVAQGQLASKKDLDKAFGNSDRAAAIRHVLDHGELQVSEEEREHAQESMFRDVAAIVVDKSINPENNRPYTLTMIQNAMKEIHYSVNTNKGAKSQALDVIRRLKAVMPIARAKMKVRLECPTGMWIRVCEEISSEGIALQLLPEAGGGDADTDTDTSQNVVDNTVFSAVSEATNKSTADDDADGSNVYTPTAPAVSETEREAISSFDFLIDPEAYRPLQVVMENVCGARGFVQVLQLNASVASVAPNVAAAGGAGAGSSADSNAKASDDVAFTTASLPAAAEDEDDEDDEEGNAYNSDQLAGLHIGTNKAGKREKRAAKESKMAKEAEAVLLKARLERDAEREKKKAHAALLEADSNSTEAEAVFPVSAPSPSVAPGSGALQHVAPLGGLKACNTCGGAFDAAAYREHFRSEWHRFNLKVKMKNKKPINEAQFLALSVEALALFNM